MDDWTFRFKDDGLLLNADITYDPVTGQANPFVDILNVTGLSNAPFRTTENNREGQDGGFVDAEFEQMRTIVLEGMVYANVNTVAAYLQSLKKNFGPNKTVQPFYFKEPGLNDRVVFAKSYGVNYDWTTALRTGTTPVQFQLIAEDPSIYDAEPTTATIGLSIPAGGRGYNRAYNYAYGAASLGGMANVFNGGDKDATATIKIFGPVTDPGVYHDVTGRVLQFQMVLLTGQFLTINLRNRTVYLNDSASRRNALTNYSRWFLLSPGSNSLRFLGSDPIGGAPDPIMSVEARGAYR